MYIGQDEIGKRVCGYGIDRGLKTYSFILNKAMIGL